MGLAWTSMGGATLYIEAAKVAAEKTEMKLTGQAGDVMKESAAIAMSYVRTIAERYGIASEAFRKHDFHIHFPAGAIRKDGPSAGVTITTALLSLLLQRPLVAGIAMTGEITLSGNVLAVGGIREKLVAAKRMGMRTVLLPAANRADVADIPEEVKGKLNIIFAHVYHEWLPQVFSPPLTLTKKKQRIGTNNVR